MTSKLASHLMKSRHGIYYLRLTNGGKEKRKSLRTRDPTAARAAAYALGAKLSLIDPKILAAATDFKLKQRAQERLDALKNSADEESYFQLLLQQNPNIKAPPEPQSAPVIAPSITIEEAVDKYKDARKNDIKDGTKRTWESCYNKLMVAFEGREIRTISPEEITQIIVNPINGKSPSTASKDVGVWSRMFEWLRLHKLIEYNPVIKPQFRNIRTQQLKKEFSRDYALFDNNDIKTLFSSEHLSSFSRPEDVWLQLIGLTTGARLESISRIKVEDVTRCTLELVAIYDKQFIQRILPIHPLLIRAGFLTYVSEIEEKFGRKSYLFTEMNEIKSRRSHGYSQRFGRQRESLGLTKGRVFHSFRSTVISAIDKNGGNGQARRLYVGHKVKENLDVEEMAYLKSQYTPDELSKAIFPHIQWQIDDWKYEPRSALAQIERLTKIREQGTLQEEHKAAVKKEKAKPKNKAKIANGRQKRLEKQKAYAEVKSNTTDQN